ncbi:MAG: 50S ribosomal protein L30e [Euryarchaeota archaeon]|nr:50S ribosomal protein L30e [Euryarchaeota archaeon]|tara:strand:- start:47144 stop:47440 length:297 start_codon:yes stop_codon:yes gene_type:complete
MDLGRNLKQGLNTGKILFGQRETMGACDKGEARLVIVAANCPEEFIAGMSDSHPNITVHRVGLVNRQLGAACAKPFPVSALCVIDPGQSDLLSLQSNL